MKISRKLKLATTSVFVLALLLGSSYLVGAAAVSSEFDDTQYTAPFTKGHASGLDSAGDSTLSNGGCITCHNTTIPGNALGAFRSAHTVHMSSLFTAFGRMTGEDGNKNGCTLCHPDTNTSNYLEVTGTASNTPMSYEGDHSYTSEDGTTTDVSQSLRRNVNADFCVRCHGQQITGVASAHGGNDTTGCRFCHGGGVHGTTEAGAEGWINIWFSDGDQTDQRCLRCHGSRAWYVIDEVNPEVDSATYRP